jgi:predicted DNA-binding transcriptional regulator YafY
MRHGPDVRVEAPDELRERLATRLREAAAQYAS